MVGRGGTLSPRGSGVITRAAGDRRRRGIRTRTADQRAAGPIRPARGVAVARVGSWRSTTWRTRPAYRSTSMRRPASSTTSGSPAARTTSTAGPGRTTASWTCAVESAELARALREGVVSEHLGIDDPELDPVAGFDQWRSGPPRSTTGTQLVAMGLDPGPDPSTPTGARHRGPIHLVPLARRPRLRPGRPSALDAAT